jgi:hypothetical protein
LAALPVEPQAAQERQLVKLDAADLIPNSADAPPLQQRPRNAQPRAWWTTLWTRKKTKTVW